MPKTQKKEDTTKADKAEEVSSGGDQTAKEIPTYEAMADKKTKFKPVTYRSTKRKFMTFLPTGELYDRSVDGVIRKFPHKKKISFDDYIFVAQDKDTADLLDSIIEAQLAKGSKPPFVVAEEFKPEVPQKIGVVVNGVNQTAVYNPVTQKYEVENSQTQNQTLKRND